LRSRLYGQDAYTHRKIHFCEVACNVYAIYHLSKSVVDRDVLNGLRRIYERFVVGSQAYVDFHRSNGGLSLYVVECRFLFRHVVPLDVVALFVVLRALYLDTQAINQANAGVGLGVHKMDVATETANAAEGDLKRSDGVVVGNIGKAYRYALHLFANVDAESGILLACINGEDGAEDIVGVESVDVGSHHEWCVLFCHDAIACHVAFAHNEEAACIVAVSIDAEEVAIGIACRCVALANEFVVAMVAQAEHLGCHLELERCAGAAGVALDDSATHRREQIVAGGVFVAGGDASRRIALVDVVERLAQVVLCEELVHVDIRHGGVTKDEPFASCLVAKVELLHPFACFFCGYISKFGAVGAVDTYGVGQLFVFLIVVVDCFCLRQTYRYAGRIVVDRTKAEKGSALTDIVIYVELVGRFRPLRRGNVCALQSAAGDGEEVGGVVEDRLPESIAKRRTCGANAVGFLASDGASFITGEVLSSNGGYVI